MATERAAPWARFPSWDVPHSLLHQTLSCLPVGGQGSLPPGMLRRRVRLVYGRHSSTAQLHFPAICPEPPLLSWRKAPTMDTLPDCALKCPIPQARNTAAFLRSQASCSQMLSLALNPHPGGLKSRTDEESVLEIERQLSGTADE
eukprot:scaffold521_cov308-Prasinococcus_capsulatus_cf.AAC.8